MKVEYMTKKLSLKARMGLLLSAATLVAASCTPVLAQPPPSPTPSYTPSTAAVIEPLPSDTPTLSSTNTPILTDTPTLTPTPVPPTYTPTPSSTPTPFSILLRVITDANLRGGPGTVYDRVGGAEEGDVFCPVRYAHGEDGHVWYALDRNSNGYDPGDSWIRDDLVDPNVENIIELLPLIMEISPTPTPVPVATPALDYFPETTAMLRGYANQYLTEPYKSLDFTICSCGETINEKIGGPSQCVVKGTSPDGTKIIIGSEGDRSPLFRFVFPYRNNVNNLSGGELNALTQQYLGVSFNEEERGKNIEGDFIYGTIGRGVALFGDYGIGNLQLLVEWIDHGS